MEKELSDTERNCHSRDDLKLELPYDMLLRIFTHLTVEDAVSVSLSCKNFRTIFLDHHIWRVYALRQLNHGRRFPIADINAEVERLRRAVMRSDAIESNWASERPKCFMEREVDFYQKKLGHDNQTFMTWQSNFIPAACEHLYLGDKDETLFCWNTVQYKPQGEFAADGNIMLRYPGMYYGGDLYLLQCFVTNTAIFRPISMNVVQVKKSPTDLQTSHSSVGLTITESRQLAVPMNPFSFSKAQVLDVSKRMFYCTFHCPELFAGLLVVFDWDTGLYAAVKTPSRLELQKYILGAYLSKLGEEECLVIRSEGGGLEARTYYSLAQIREHAEIQDDDHGEYMPIYPTVEPVHREALEWYPDSLSRLPRHDLASRISHTFSNDWSLGNLPSSSTMSDQTSLPFRRLTSTFILYRVLSAQIDVKWRIAHYYTDESDRGLSTRTLTRRNIATLVSPFLERSPGSGRNPGPNPLLCLSFNHVGWIEQREEPEDRAQAEADMDAEAALSMYIAGSPGVPTRKVFLLATLPDIDLDATDLGEAGGEVNLRDRARELDIPNKVLQKAVNVWMDAAKGTISVATTSFKLYVYHF